LRRIADGTFAIDFKKPWNYLISSISELISNTTFGEAEKIKVSGRASERM